MTNAYRLAMLENDELRAKLERWEAIDLGKIDAIRELRALLEEQRKLIQAYDATAAELRAEVDRLQADNTRLAECWTTEQETHQQTQAELERLRTKLDLLTECLRPGLDEAPDGPATFLRAARKILGRPNRAPLAG
jgi:predicted  nucleic acid-binding Zn-ribbon protein